MAIRKTSKMTRRSSPSRNGKKDAISLLKGDHKQVLELLEKLVSGRPSKSSEALLSKIGQELHTHSRIEEEIFYPAFKEVARKKDDQKLFFEAREEHPIVDVVLDEFQGAENSEAFSAKCKLLKELVANHIKEEESEMFPLARKAMGAAMLRDLGEKLEERKLEIISQAA